MVTTGSGSEGVYYSVIDQCSTGFIMAAAFAGTGAFSEDFDDGFLAYCMGQEL